MLLEADRGPQFLHVLRHVPVGKPTFDLDHQVGQSVGDGVELVVQRLIVAGLAVMTVVAVLMINRQVSTSRRNRMLGAQTTIRSTQKAKKAARP